MALEAIGRLGAGVVLAWAALPLLFWLARRSQAAAPAAYYHALVSALCIATALIFAPLVRSWSGSPLAVSGFEPSSSAQQPGTISFVAELVRPLLGAARRAWPTLPFAEGLAAVGGMWLLLFCGGVSASIAGRLRLRRELRDAPLAPAQVLARAQRIAAELGIRTPDIRIAATPAAAFSYGAISPVVVLGASACDMPGADLEFVLRHELCHIARHDTRAIYLIDLAQRCFACHPSVRTLAAEIRVAREARADLAAAGGNALEYARFLLSIAEHMQSGRAASPLVSMADTALERRVHMLIDPATKRSPVRRSTLWLALTGFSLWSFVFLTPASWGQPQGTAGDHLAVRGNLSVAQVEQALFAKPQPMLDCYAALSAPRANLSLQLAFEIDAAGRVSHGQVSAPDHPELEPCLHAALMQRSFPQPSSGSVSVEGRVLLTPRYTERRAVLEAREGTSQRLSAAVIRATVRSYYPQLRDCFERLHGTVRSASVSMSFIIDRDGNTSDGETTDKSEPAAPSQAFTELAQCVDSVRRTMQFPAPQDGIVTVDYPLLFEDTPPPGD